MTIPHCKPLLSHLHPTPVAAPKTPDQDQVPDC
jgi:hypothetical protein